MKNVRSFIFDLDGTLVDSFSQITSALNQTRIAEGFPSLPGHVAEALIGQPAKDLFQDLALDELKVGLLVARFRGELAKAINDSNKLFDGVVEFLDNALDLGIRTAVATSKPQSLAELVVQKSALAGRIGQVQGTDDFPPKPNPEVIRRALGGHTPNLATMFGDRPEDMRAGVLAGVTAVGIAQSTFSSNSLYEAGATIVFPNFIAALESMDFLEI